jgi:hypothetical protein
MPGPRGPLVYYSPQRGVAKQQTDTELTYYGVTYRIARADLARMRPEGLGPAAVLPAGDHDPYSYMQRRDDLEPARDTALERYEVFEPETGDLVVMWRIPCRRAVPAARDTHPRRQP